MRVETEVAVVVRQSRDEVMIGEQPRLRDEIDVDLVIRVRPADVPDLIGFARVFLPFVASQAAVHRLKSRPVGSEQHIVAAVAVQEIERRAAEQVVVPLAAQRPIQARHFQIERCITAGHVGSGIEHTVVVQVAIVEPQLAGRSLDVHTEVCRRAAADESRDIAETERRAGHRNQPRLRRDRPGVDRVLARTSENIVVPLPAEHHVMIGRRSGSSIAPQAIVAGEAVQHVAAQSAVERITTRCADQQVVAAVSREPRHEIAAAGRQRGQVQRLRQAGRHRIRDADRQLRVRCHEADHVVPRESSDLELLDQRRTARRQHRQRPH